MNLPFLGNRPIGRIVAALFGRQHYLGLVKAFRVYVHPGRALYRYLTGAGEYPCSLQVRTPTGRRSMELFSCHEMLTAHEIFCRHDYGASTGARTVVDIGSNIGISALYFLSRNDYSRCYLYEPVSQNVARLTANLLLYRDRYALERVAIGDFSGEVTFGVEPTGRYGGIGVPTAESIRCNCLQIDEVLRGVLEREPFIDVLKIDTEGMEETTVRAIDHRLLRRIGKIYLEACPSQNLIPDVCLQHQRGSVCVLTPKRTALSLSAAAGRA